MFHRLPTLPMAFLAFACLVCVSLATGCSDAPPEPEPLRVYAAASLTDVVGELVTRYEADHDATVATSFGGSSALARQIRDGAPADVFLSASPEWIEYLREAGRVDGEPVVVARNRMVAVSPRGSRTAEGISADDAASLLENLADDDGVAIADHGVPAGEYARAALTSLGLLDSFRPHLVGQSDVRAVLRAVAQGELRAGFVYATDAGADVDVLFAFEASSHPPIEYQAVTLRDASDRGAAHQFLAYLLSEPARAHLESAGFELP